MKSQKIFLILIAFVAALGVGAAILKAKPETDPNEFVDESKSQIPIKKLAKSELAELKIHDFETDSLGNYIDGESGAWTTDPEDDTAWAEVEIVDDTVKGSERSKVLKLDYALDSEYQDHAKGGFWTKLGDLDASPYDHLEFFVRADEEQGATSVFRIEVKKYKDEKRIEKLQGSFLVKSIGSEWQLVSIPLNRMTGILDFAEPEVWQDPSVGRRNLDELVIVLEGRRVDQMSGVLYFDDIRFVKTGNPGPTAVDFPPRLKGDKTPTPMTGVDFARFLVGRLQGYPTQTVVKKDFPEDDREFLMMIAKDTWRFFDEIVDREHQLPLDTIQLGRDTPIAEDGWVGDYTNVTNIGVYLMCLAAGYDLGFLTREDVLDRVSRSIHTLEAMEYHHESGFLYNYYDTTTLERTSYFVSYVDSGWLVAGLYVVKGAFPELADEIDPLLQRGSFAFYYDDVDQHMFHGFYEHLEVYSDYHYGVFYTEPRAISAMAIGRGEVPKEHWFKMIRTFPEEFGWQQQIPIEVIEKETLGTRYKGGYYEWNDLKYVPSWGGSLFEALMPTMVLKEKELAPLGLGANNAVHVQGHIRFAKEELGYKVWGMSPSSVPNGGYSEYGTEFLGSKGYKAGVVTPHVSFLSLEYAPEEAIANLRALIANYDIYGEYGFYDAVDPLTGDVAYKYLALDQGMSFVALCNYLKDGVIRDHFNANEFASVINPLLAEEEFFTDDDRFQGEREVTFS